jgi:hypothetical protein
MEARRCLSVPVCPLEMQGSAIQIASGKPPPANPELSDCPLPSGRPYPFHSISPAVRRPFERKAFFTLVWTSEEKEDSYRPSMT